MSGSVELTESKLVVVFVVENVEKGGEERMKILILSKMASKKSALGPALQ